MLYRDGTESEPTLITSGTLVRYAGDLKPSSTAIISPEKLPLLQLDLEVCKLRRNADLNSLSVNNR